LKRGLTLMEVLLTVTLVAVFAGGSFALIGLQFSAYSRSTYTADAVAKLSQTYQLMYKEIREQSRKAIFDNSASTTIKIAPNSILFEAKSNDLYWKGERFLKGVAANFTPMVASNLIRIELVKRAANQDDVALSFVVFPRNP